MIRAEFKKLKYKKSLYILPLVTLICIIFWIISTYYTYIKMPSDEGVKQSIEVLLQPQNIFFKAMKEICLSIYIFPLVVVGVVFVYDDLKEGVLVQIAVLSKNRIKYFMNKINCLIIYFFIVLVAYFIVTTSISFFLPEVTKVEWIDIFSVYSLSSFLIYWFGIVFFAIVSMLITYVTSSAVGGAGITIFYILFERIFTSNTAMIIKSPLLMKINEYLPWSNFNSLFVYASDLHNIMLRKNINAILELTMFKMGPYEGIVMPLPFLKSIWSLLFIIIAYFIVTITLFYRIYQNRISKS